MNWNRVFLFFMILLPTAMITKIITKNRGSELWKSPSEKRFQKNQQTMESNHCVTQCFSDTEIPEPVRNFFYEVYHDVFKSENPTNIRRIFNATMLKKYCGYATEHRQCVEKCNSGRSDKIDSLVILQLNSYICNETDFIHRALCYRKVYEQDLDGCESSNKCFRHKMDMINLVNQNSSVIQVSPSEAARDLFSYLCQYIKCGNQCRSKILSEQCGKESNEILLEFYRLVVASMKQTVVEVYHFFTGKILIINDTCNKI